VFVRHRDVQRAFEEFTAALEACDIDVRHLRLERRHELRGGTRYELREHGNILPWHVVRYQNPPVVARSVGSRDALKALTFATEVLAFVSRRRPLAPTPDGATTPPRRVRRLFSAYRAR
jgi:hypothetical protein